MWPSFFFPCLITLEGVLWLRASFSVQCHCDQFSCLVGMAGSTGMLRVSIGFALVKRNFLGPGSLQGHRLWIYTPKCVALCTLQNGYRPIFSNKEMLLWSAFCSKPMACYFAATIFFHDFLDDKIQFSCCNKMINTNWSSFCSVFIFEWVKYLLETLRQYIAQPYIFAFK